MIEISEYLWETLYAIKAVYDHDPKAQIFQLYKDTAIDGDDLFEIAENAINQFFDDTREYFNEDNEVATYVFFDPIITQYWKLCDEYEKRLQLDPKENRFRSDMNRALESALYIPDYSYNAAWYSDTKHKNGCRIVILCYLEFNTYHWIPTALSEAYDAFVHYTQQIKAAIAEVDQPKIGGLKGPGCQDQRKKVA